MIGAPVRPVLLGVLVGVVLLVVALGWALLTGPAPAGVVGPFVAAAVAVLAARAAGPVVDRVAGRLGRRPAPAPYAVLAGSAARVREGSLPDALPGLARVLGEGTAAERAVVWLVVDDVLVAEAVHPPGPEGDEGRGERVGSLGLLLARPGVDHAVPVLDGDRLRAVLTITKAGRPVTSGDRRLVRDVAGGAQLVLQGVARGAELAARVRRVDELAAETAASRRRLEVAREVERRRLVTELRGATSDRLAGFRQSISDAAESLEEAAEDPDDPEAAEMARHHVAEARERLGELIDRFRVIARGVHPAVLREQGPRAALEEVAADLPRAVHLSGRLTERLPWEIESGLYYAASSAVTLLAARPGRPPLEVALEHQGDTVAVRIADPDPDDGPDEVRAALADDVDRLAALGGALDATASGDRLELRAWLPDRLRPVVLDAGAVA